MKFGFANLKDIQIEDGCVVCSNSETGFEMSLCPNGEMRTQVISFSSESVDLFEEEGTMFLFYQSYGTDDTGDYTDVYTEISIPGVHQLLIDDTYVQVDNKSLVSFDTSEDNVLITCIKSQSNAIDWPIPENFMDMVMVDI